MASSQREALIVDDDADIREVLRDILEGVGYTVQEAADGEDALTILRTSPHGLLVLLDNLLPDVDGVDLFAMLEYDASVEGASARAAHPALRHAFVLITASPHMIAPDLQAHLARRGMPVIAKPFELATLTTALDYATRFLEP